MENEVEKAAQQYAERYIKKQNESHSFNDSDTIILKTTDRSMNSSSQSSPKDNIIIIDDDSNIKANGSIDDIRRKDSNNSSKSFSSSNNNISAIVALYKILLLPEDALSLYVKAERKETLLKEYKRIARLIHPDKNNHVKSKQAFQKLRRYWIDRC